MSFFITNKRKQDKNKFDKKGKKGSKRKRFEKEEDELTSSSGEDVDNGEDNNIESDSDEEETAQDKRIRLAKAYLKDIEKEVLERQQNADELEINGDIINKHLRDDHLKQSGRLRLKVADKCKSVDESNIIILKNKSHKNCVTCVTVTSDDKHMFSGSKDGSIVKWQIEGFVKIGCIPFTKDNTDNKFKGHSKGITSIAISTDIKYLAVGDESSNIQVWNPLNLEHVHTLSGHRGPVTGVVFRRDTHTLYSCSKDRSVKVWSLDQMAYVETLYGHMDMVTSIDALSRERALTSGGQDSSLRMWKIVEESQLIYNGPVGNIDVVRFINEETFLSGGDNGQLCIWGANKKKPLCIVKDAHGLDPTNQQPYWITSVASLLNTDLIASGSQDGFVRIWKLGDNYRDVELLFKIPVNGFVNSLVFTSCGKYLIAGVGREHRFGRWSVVKSAKTSIVVIPLL